MLSEDKTVFKKQFSKVELEVSEKKLFTRIRTVVFLITIIGVFYYITMNTTDSELHEVLSSAIQYSVLNLAYFVLSVINQSYALYFNKKYLELHTREEEEAEKS